MGAAILAVRGAFRSGAGLVHAFLPASEMHLMPVAVPEAMTIPQEHFSYTDLSSFNTVGIGPGLGTDKNAEVLVGYLCKNFTSPWVIDADAINILSQRPDLFKAIPKQSIFTPHPVEFKRLAGEWGDDFEKVEKLRSFCLKHGFNIALKGAYTMVCSSKGIIYFNPTGNPGMATAGSGDVLTGIVTALTGQGLAPIDALKLGVYVHGLAGDMAKKKYGEISMKASDIIEQLPSAFSAIAT